LASLQLDQHPHTTCRRVGDEYVINGRMFTHGSLAPNCQAFHRVESPMGKKRRGESADPHNVSMSWCRWHPLLGIVRNVAIMHHHAPEGHCEVVFQDVACRCRTCS